MARMPGVAGCARERRFGGARDAEFRRCCLAERQQARVAEGSGQGCIRFEAQARSVNPAAARGVSRSGPFQPQILHGEGDARERRGPILASRVPGTRSVERRIEFRMHEAVKMRLQRFGASDRGFHHFHVAHAPGAQQFCEPRRVVIRVLRECGHCLPPLSSWLNLTRAHGADILRRPRDAGCSW